MYPCPLLHTKSTVLGRLPEDSIWEILKQGASKIEDVTCLPGCLDCDVALFAGADAVHAPLPIRETCLQKILIASSTGVFSVLCCGNGEMIGPFPITWTDCCLVSGKRNEGL